MCPSHVTRKWVREIGETLPDTYAMVVHSIAELDRLYAMYEQGDIQEWLGHSDFNTTANIYAHLDTTSKSASATRMSSVVSIDPGIRVNV